MSEDLCRESDSASKDLSEQITCLSNQLEIIRVESKNADSFSTEDLSEQITFLCAQLRKIKTEVEKLRLEYSKESPGKKSLWANPVITAVGGFIFASILSPPLVSELIPLSKRLLNKSFLNYSCTTTVHENIIPHTNTREELNVRSGGGTWFNTVGKPLLHNTPITIVEHKNQWVRLSDPIEGWVASNRTKVHLDCPELFE
ncbi:MAG: SH3 domain-containing protein [Cyanobacteria bacterium P01_F01_bin.33]